VFEKVIVLGCGTAAVKCAEILLKKGITPEIYCADEAAGSMAGRVRSLLGSKASERLFVDKAHLTEILAKEEERTLLVSAANYYIVPRTILEKGNLVAVNFHNACLPFHPGRNAEAWSIFEEDPFSGITWHYMVPQVDKGAVIFQGKIELTPETTSFSLLRQQNLLAVKSFGEIIDGLLFGKPDTKPQAEAAGVKMHYSHERPNDGLLDLEWSAHKMSAFLRCYDYGPFHTLGFPAIEWNGVRYCWEDYKILETDCEDEFITVKDDVLSLQKGKTLFQLTNVRKAED